MNNSPGQPAETQTLHGGCHCGAVRFAIEVHPPLTLQRCNCSMCSRTDFIHLIVPASRFHLLQGGENLSEYRFNTGTARHLFCKICGIKSFYIPRSNPDGYSVNARCLENFDWQACTVEAFDGQHWEAHAEKLAHLSRED